MSTISNRTIKLIILFGLIAFSTGMTKNFLISNLFPEQLKSIVLLSSNVSMGVSIILPMPYPGNYCLCMSKSDKYNEVLKSQKFSLVLHSTDLSLR